jgi:hypothetical protein
MSMWRLSDGTVIEPGGEVAGSSKVADNVRYTFAECRFGPVLFPLGPQPDSSGKLRLGDLAAIDAWLKYKAPIWGVTVVERPHIENPLVDRRDLTTTRGACY